jgi:CTP synthase
MRLGAYPAKLREGSRARAIYGTDAISERHRHRFEVNNEYRPLLEEHGMVFSGTSPDGGLVEMVEITDHPWFLACQFHPELKSRPMRPAPLFASFIEAAARHARRAGEVETAATGG